jgi:hypothetical protein
MEKKVVLENEVRGYNGQDGEDGNDGEQGCQGEKVSRVQDPVEKERTWKMW